MLNLFLIKEWKSFLGILLVWMANGEDIAFSAARTAFSLQQSGGIQYN